MANPTTNLSMTKPTVGGSTDTWGTTLNENVVDIIDALFSISGTDVTMSDIKFNSVGLQETGAGTDTVKIQAPSAVTQYTLTMPGAVGSDGQVLSADGAAGVLEWTTPEVGDITSVADATNGGMTVTNGTGPDVTLALNFNDLLPAAVNVATDSIAFIDADDSSTKKESIADLAIAMGGTGLSEASGTLAVDASQTQITSVGALGAGSISSGFGAIDVGSSSIDGGTITGTFSGNLTGNVTGNCSGSAGSATGNAATATALATARAINGTSFDGTAAITVTAAAGTLTGATLNSGVTASSLTSVGTISSLVATTADINAGTFDGIVGGTTPADGSFTTLSASGLTLDVGGTLTTVTGNDLNIVYPINRSLYFKEADVITLTLDNAQGATFTGAVAVTGNLTVETDLFQVVTADGRIYVNDGGGTTPALDGATVAAFQNNAAVGRECRLAIIAGTAGISSIVFGDDDDEDQGRFFYAHDADTFTWETAGSGTDRMTLDGSGNWMVAGTMTAAGLPTSDPSAAGALWNDSGTMKISSG